MAASLLFSLPLSNNRIAQACVPFLPSHQNGMRCFSMFLQKKRCNFEPYMILSKTMNRQCIFKTFASVSSINADMVFQEDVASSGSSNESAFLSRSRPLLDDPSNPSNGVNDFARQLQELFDEVKAMILMGNSSDAMDLLQANYEIVKELIDAGARGIEEAAMLDIIALGYMAIGDLGTVGSILNLLNMVIKNLKDDGPLLDSVLMHMGSMYSALGKFEKSMIAYQRVISVLESKYGESSIFIVPPLLGMGKVLGSIGRVNKATEVYQRVIIILESGRGAESKELVVPLFGLGNLLMKEGRTTDAEIHFIRILNIYRKLYGENDGRYGMALCSVANLKCSTGNVEEAIDLYRKALEVIKDSNYMAKDDTVMEKMRIDLAELLHVVGRGKEGRELLEECLLITEEYKGKEHPSSVAHLLNLATSYSQSKNFVEAERLLRISLEIMMKTVSPEDQSVTFPMLQLAMTLYNLNRDEEAEQLAVEVLRIREKAFGKDSLPVGEALDCLVSIQTRLERADTELLELLKRVLKIQEKEFGYESEEILQTLKKIVFYLAKVGRKDEKFSMQKRLSVLRTKYKQMVRY
ncbi:protein KINESIN LIGHT CHAIN-RELATED 2 isoform X1 [Ricinus communis]|uniref:protein KINESIN LIGHT CHAIN-RELATED 2 isoform X1 n=2 Tax=Ricinus communis TaxID=3988 RepID=UPI00201AFFE4|nr:protein KINESIN LIGHT CHAIN-RELATED 2 isoform X1 [Ricinus communis]